MSTTTFGNVRLLAAVFGAVARAVHPSGTVAYHVYPRWKNTRGQEVTGVAVPVADPETEATTKESVFPPIPESMTSFEFLNTMETLLIRRL